MATTKKPPLAPHRKFIIEVRGEEIKVNKFGDKLHSLIDDLGWEYQRMGMSGRETYDETVSYTHLTLPTIGEV